MGQDDRRLIERYLDGEVDAFTELVRRWQRPLFAFLLRCTGNADDARELAQETFRTACEKLPGLQDRDRFSPWLYKIALNHSRMLQRRQRSRPTEPLDDAVGPNGEPPASFAQLARDGQPSPEESLSRTEMAEVVRTALFRLEPRQREVILLKEYAGLKFTEIADTLATPLSTVKSRMYLGLENLKREILRLIAP